MSLVSAMEPLQLSLLLLLVKDIEIPWWKTYVWLMIIIYCIILLTVVGNHATL